MTYKITILENSLLPLLSAGKLRLKMAAFEGISLNTMSDSESPEKLESRLFR